MKTANVGQYLFNSILPKEYRDNKRNFHNPKMLNDLLTRMARELPSGEYRDVLRDIFKLGADVTYYEGSSFSLEDLKIPQKTKDARNVLSSEVNQILANPNFSRDEKNAAVIAHVQKSIKGLNNVMMAETKSKDSGLAKQVQSGSRGNAGDLQSLLLGDMLMEDAKGNAIPIPLLHGYAEGVDPAEYFSNSFGTRMGVLSTKKSVADSGYLSKRMKQVAHRQVITQDDCGTQRAIEVNARDPENIGAVLAEDVGDYKIGTPITASVLKRLKGDTIRVRSALTCDSSEGLCAKCVGIRESGEFPEVGDNIGIIAGQSVGEKATQKALSAKHSAGRATGNTKGNFVEGYDLIEQLMSVPKSFTDAAVTSNIEGTVELIEPAPQGGQNITIDGEVFHVPTNMDPIVKRGDVIEPGDLLSNGIPDPSQMIKYKGIGETRRIFTDQLKEATGASRRNTEVMAKAFVDYIRITEPDLYPNTAPDDIMKYSDLAKNWKPRKGFRTLAPRASVGQYLETPVAQYTIGTRVTPKVANELSRRGFKKIDTHQDEPPFEPVMVPSVRALTHSDDWQERMGGYHLKDSLLDAASKGMKSQVHSTSFIPGILKGTDFGSTLRETGTY